MRFSMKLYINGIVYSKGFGQNKAEAKKAAASNLL